MVQAVDGLGGPGEQVTVNQGFAHNWLFPKKLAAYDLQANHGGRKPTGSRVSVHPLPARPHRTLSLTLLQNLSSAAASQQAQRDGSEPAKAKDVGAKEAQQLSQIMTRLLSSPLVRRKHS